MAGNSKESTTPMQAFKHCARLLRLRSQHLPFVLAYTSSKAGYASFFVSTSTYNQIYPLDLLFQYFEIVSCTYSPDFLHNLLSHLHSHVR